MTITMDTNVLFSALHSSEGASHYILRMVLDERATLALSNSLYFEYRDVLTRETNLDKLGLCREDVEAVLDALVPLARKKAVYFRLRPNLLDESDNMLIECAWASNADLIVTHNKRHFLKSELTGFRFRVVTPREFMIEWRQTGERE